MTHLTATTCQWLADHLAAYLHLCWAWPNFRLGHADGAAPNRKMEDAVPDYGLQSPASISAGQSRGKPSLGHDTVWCGCRSPEVCMRCGRALPRFAALINSRLLAPRRDMVVSNTTWLEEAPSALGLRCWQVQPKSMLRVWVLE
jgi:hypothetical protein